MIQIENHVQGLYKVCTDPVQGEKTTMQPNTNAPCKTCKGSKMAKIGPGHELPWWTLGPCADCQAGKQRFLKVAAAVTACGRCGVVGAPYGACCGR